MKYRRTGLRTWSVFVLLFFFVGGVAGALPDQGARGSGDWAPPDVDDAVPPVDPDVPCSLPEVVAGATQRVEEFLVNMQRFSAKERAQFVEFDKKGISHDVASAVFSYVAYIHEVRPGSLTVEEYRNDSVGVQSFPSSLATTGTAAYALLFHSDYVKDFAWTCEGLARLQGQPAWQLHFVQLPNPSNNFHGYRVAGAYYQVKLRGRAWISQDRHEVLRLETDLLEPIPAARLLKEHVAVEYGPVDFPKRDLRLWLPQSSEIFMDYRSRRYRHRHSFSDFKLFWVDTEQRSEAPRKR